MVVVVWWCGGGGPGVVVLVWWSWWCGGVCVCVCGGIFCVCGGVCGGVYDPALLCVIIIMNFVFSLLTRLAYMVYYIRRCEKV